MNGGGSCACGGRGSVAQNASHSWGKLGGRVGSLAAALRKAAGPVGIQGRGFIERSRWRGWPDKTHAERSWCVMCLRLRSVCEGGRGGGDYHYCECCVVREVGGRCDVE